MYESKHGLVYEDGTPLTCQAADAAARRNGFQCAEEFVRELQKQKEAMGLPEQAKALAMNVARTSPIAGSSRLWIENIKRQAEALLRRLEEASETRPTSTEAMGPLPRKDMRLVTNEEREQSYCPENLQFVDFINTEGDNKWLFHRFSRKVPSG